ncbi:MAG: hypothetical protein RXO24_06335 [Acidilobus sp.]
MVLRFPTLSAIRGAAISEAAVMALAAPNTMPSSAAEAPYLTWNQRERSD